jgi:hypothetical protein
MNDDGRYGIPPSGPPCDAYKPRKFIGSSAEEHEVNLDALPRWAEPVAEPFRRDPAFWRAVYASADALVLVLVAGIAALVLGRAELGVAICLLPFAVPLFFVGWALLSGFRSSRASRVWFRTQGEEDLAAWRDSEREAVARVFLRAVLRNRLTYP